MDFYSAALALAFVAAACQLLLIAFLRMAPRRMLSDERPPAVRRGAVFAGLASTLLLILSAAHHVAIGHRPGSASGLGPVAFIAEHPAFLVGAGAVALGFALLRTRK